MFLEQEFPTALAFLAEGGPSYSTTVNEGFSGFEQRNQNWAFGRGKWTVALDHKTPAYFNLAYNFWNVAAGRLNSFRFRDYKDFSATNQLIANGTSAHPTNGTNKQFQLQRVYNVGGNTYAKPIQKPIMSSVLAADGSALADTVIVYDNGTPVSVSVDATTGVITFGTAPVAGHTITADFQFSYPVRFDMDEIGSARIEDSPVNAGLGNMLISWTGIKLVEIKIPLTTLA